MIDFLKFLFFIDGFSVEGLFAWAFLIVGVVLPGLAIIMSG